MKPVIYLATPYSSTVASQSKELAATKPDYDDKEIREKRFKKVNEVAAKLWNAGFWVMSPISMTHPIAEEGYLKKDFSEWEQFNYYQVSVCHMVFVLCIDGWDKSVGVAKEIAFAQKIIFR